MSATRSPLPATIVRPISAATVSFISPQAEYTPPFIYSERTRSKFVFLAEARPPPAQAALLNPGQPVTVKPIDAAPMSDYAIDVNGLRKSFGDLKVVEGLNLQVAEGEICGFLGANGSGKTTTIRMLCGLLKPDGGSGQCLGYDIIDEPHEIRRQVGYMTQRFSLYDDLTVFENLDFVARVYEMPNRRTAVRDDHGAHGARKTAATSWRGNCRADGSSASRSPPACCISRSSCCSTSRPRASTPRRGANSGTSSTTWRSRG